MATVNVSITLKKQTVPADPPASSTIRYQLRQGSTVVDQQDAGLPGVSVSFSNVADGTYTVSAQRLNNLIAPIGDAAVSDPFIVVNTTEIDVPDVLAVTM